MKGVVIISVIISGLVICHGEIYDGLIEVPEQEECWEDIPCGIPYEPLSPLILCDHLSDDFVTCVEPRDLQGNVSDVGGCSKFGFEKAEEVEMTFVNCSVLNGIECSGNRTFLRQVPCIKFSGHHFVTILLFSIFLGFIGLDRFCLGHIPTALGKLLTLGGLGVWWITDIFLLVTGQLMPNDDSNWCP